MALAVSAQLPFEAVSAFDECALPPQDISALHFCGSARLPKVRDYAEQLKPNQTAATGAELYAALPELARLKTDPKTRFDMLELLWPTAQYVSGVLARDSLAQSGTGNEAARRSQIVSQSIQKQFLDGYSVCVRDLAAEAKLKPLQIECQLNAVYRALWAAGLLMLRNYQHYAQAPGGVWRRAHTLYRAALERDLERRRAPVAGSERIATPYAQYLRLLCLSAAHPNQLGQNDIATCFAALADWADHVRLVDLRTQHHYCVDPNTDCGAQLAKRFAEPGPWGLDFTALAAGISQNPLDKVQLLGGPGRIAVPGEVSSSLLEHLLGNWTQSKDRDTQRRRTEARADAAAGLTDCHLQLCDGEPFDRYINEHETETAAGAQVSPGFGDLINKLSKPKDLGSHKPRQTLFDAVIQNISDGGCCVFWPGPLPSRVEAGELIGLREPNRRAWQLGLVRWVRKLKTGSELGVLMLADEAEPFGAAASFDMGGQAEFMRAMHLPRPLLDNTPAALLTPAVPFQENSRVTLKRDGQTTPVRLGRCLLATSKIKLFAFDHINPERA